MHMDKRRVSLVAKVCAQSFQSQCMRYFICMHMYVCMGPLFIFICMYVYICILNFVNIYVCMEALSPTDSIGVTCSPTPIVKSAKALEPCNAHCKSLLPPSACRLADASISGSGCPEPVMSSS